MINWLIQQFSYPGFTVLTVVTDEQLEFLKDTNAVLKEKTSSSSSLAESNSFGKGSSDPGDSNDEVFTKISEMEENLKAAINNLITGGKFSKERFPKWKKVRKDAIGKLREIVASINSERNICNKTKLAGYSASLFGGVLTLASAIGLIPALEATTPLLVTGATLATAGCATTIGTSVTEAVLVKRKTEEAQKLIEKDKKSYEKLGLIRATELQRALAEILDMCPYKELIGAVKDFVERASKIKDKTMRMLDIQSSLNMIIKKCVKKFAGLPLEMIYKIISVLIVIFELLMNTENRLIFDFALLTIRGISAIGLVLDDALDVMGLINAIFKNPALARNLTKAAVRGTISVFGIMLDIAGIISTYEDITKGSLSPEAEKIAKAADKLEEQAEKIENYYNDSIDMME